MDPLNVAAHEKSIDIREIDRLTYAVVCISSSRSTTIFFGKAMQFPAEFSINLFLPLLYAVTCFSDYKVLWTLWLPPPPFFSSLFIDLSSVSQTSRPKILE